MGDDDGSLRDEIDAAIGSGDQALVAGLVKRASPRRAELGAAAQALFAYATGLGIDIRAAADGGAGDPGASAGPLTAPPASPRPAGGWDKEEITRNLLAGLTTSFAAIALGAAFGDACGRGALVGILSAGVIAFITATFGGTRVQCSGPTAPMTTITTLVVAYSRDKEGFFKDVTQPLNASHPGCGGDGGDYNPAMCPAPDRFVNIVMLLTAGLMVVMGVGRIGKYITLVPNVVISGFMNGIAVQIWQKQVIKLYGTLVVEAPRIKGSAGYNLLITLTTTVLCFNMPKLVRKVLPPAIAKSMPATLCVIAVVTLGSILLNDCVSTDDCPFGPDSCAGCIEKTQLGATIESPSDLSKLIETQMPTVDDLQTPGLLQAASLFALQLSVLCYLDTLLTSLVVDKMVQERDGSDETTNRAKELTAQGVANGVVATFGGLPGAQATIRSVLILKEGATMRLAGMCAGTFVMVEMLIFQGVVKLIPQAVFSGVLFKVGYDCFDFTPFSIYIKSFTESLLDAKRPVEVLKKRYLKASHELTMYDSPEARALAESEMGDNEAGVFVPTKSKQHARAKVQRYANALAAKGEQVESWGEVERSEAAREQRERAKQLEASRTSSGRMMKALSSSVKSAGKSTFETLVDVNKPLPSVGHLAMMFIMGTTVVTVTINLNAAVGTFTILFHLLKWGVSKGYLDTDKWRVDDLTSDESKHSVNDVLAFHRRRRAVVGDDASLTAGLAAQSAILPHDDGNSVEMGEQVGGYVPPTIPDAGPAIGEPSPDNLFVSGGSIGAGVGEGDSSTQNAPTL